MYLLKNINIIPMNEEIVLENQDVLIKEGKIEKIGKLDLDVKTIDCSGKYLIPGLCDMHTHFNSTDHFNLFLANGVTTLRNLWGSPKVLEWKRNIESGHLLGPNVYTTGPLTDGLEFWVGAEIVKTPEEAIASVMKVKADGYDTIKTYPDIPRDAFIALMNKAREEGIKVVGHPDRNVSVDELIELGYHCIEHASLLPKEISDVEKVAKAGMWHSPTLIVVEGLLKFAKEGKDIRTIDFYDYVNDQEKEDWDKMIEFMKTIPKFKEMNWENIIDRELAFIKNSDNVLLGTDNTNPGVVTGYSIHQELKLNVDSLGMTPFQALRTGTVNAARFFEISNLTGTVEEGKLADLVILDENPLLDVSNSEKINAVIRGGKYIGRNELDQMLEKVLTMDVKEMEFALGNNELKEDN